MVNRKAMLKKLVKENEENKVRIKLTKKTSLGS